MWNCTLQRRFRRSEQWFCKHCMLLSCFVAFWLTVLLNVNLLAAWLQTVEQTQFAARQQVSWQKSLVDSFQLTTLKHRHNSWIGNFCRLDRKFRICERWYRNPIPILDRIGPIPTCEELGCFPTWTELQDLHQPPLDRGFERNKQRFCPVWVWTESSWGPENELQLCTSNAWYHNWIN